MGKKKYIFVSRGPAGPFGRPPPFGLASPPPLPPPPPPGLMMAMAAGRGGLYPHPGPAILSGPPMSPPPPPTTTTTTTTTSTTPTASPAAQQDQRGPVVIRSVLSPHGPAVVMRRSAIPMKVHPAARADDSNASVEVMDEVDVPPSPKRTSVATPDNGVKGSADDDAVSTAPAAGVEVKVDTEAWPTSSDRTATAIYRVHDYKMSGLKRTLAVTNTGSDDDGTIAFNFGAGPVSELAFVADGSGSGASTATGPVHGNLGDLVSVDNDGLKWFGAGAGAAPAITLVFDSDSDLRAMCEDLTDAGKSVVAVV